MAVTGGGGFLGRYICRKLVEQQIEVVSISRSSHPHLERMGVCCKEVDIIDLKKLTEAFAGCDAVIHTAAKAGIWGSKKEYEAVNVVGTQNVVNACLSQGIKYLVYTSSPSVVFCGGDISGGDETLTYSDSHFCHYATTKRQAEQIVLGSCKRKNFFCCALRPHLIWGPGDPHFLPRLLDRARRGTLKKIGKGNNKVDVIHVENAAEAHIQALFSMVEEPQKISGKSYFLGQEKPVKMCNFIELLLNSQGVFPQWKSISFPVAYFMGIVFEGLYKVVGRFKYKEPPITRFLALQLSRSHYFSHHRAQRDFGYFPKVSIDAGMRMLSRLRPK